MNELEVASWSIWNDSNNWDLKNIELDIFLLISAYQVKGCINCLKDDNIYFHKILEEYPNFSNDFLQWQKLNDKKTQLNIAEINRVFKLFRQAKL